MSARGADHRRGDGIALVGYRASGKSTIGRLLAERLGRSFLDSDAEVERRDGRTIASIFSEDGEAAFRDMEEAAVRNLCESHPGAVLATGGGAILREVTRSALANYGAVAYLSAPPSVLAIRLRRSGGDRPALTSAGLVEEVETVLAARDPLYRAIADLIIDTSTVLPLGAVQLLLPLVPARFPIGGRR